MSSIPQDITKSEFLYLLWEFSSSGSKVNEIFKDIIENGASIKSEKPGDFYLQSPNRFFKALFSSDGLFRIQVVNHI